MILIERPGALNKMPTDALSYQESDSPRVACGNPTYVGATLRIGSRDGKAEGYFFDWSVLPVNALSAFSEKSSYSFGSEEFQYPPLPHTATDVHDVTALYATPDKARGSFDLGAGSQRSPGAGAFPYRSRLWARILGQKRAIFESDSKAADQKCWWSTAHFALELRGIRNRPGPKLRPVLLLTRLGTVRDDPRMNGSQRIRLA